MANDNRSPYSQPHFTTPPASVTYKQSPPPPPPPPKIRHHESIQATPSYNMEMVGKDTTSHRQIENMARTSMPYFETMAPEDAYRVFENQAGNNLVVKQLEKLQLDTEKGGAEHQTTLPKTQDVSIDTIDPDMVFKGLSPDEGSSKSGHREQMGDLNLPTAQTTDSKTLDIPISSIDPNIVFKGLPPYIEGSKDKQRQHTNGMVQPTVPLPATQHTIARGPVAFLFRAAQHKLQTKDSPTSSTQDSSTTPQPSNSDPPKLPPKEPLTSTQPPPPPEATESEKKEYAEENEILDLLQDKADKAFEAEDYHETERLFTTMIRRMNTSKWRHLFEAAIVESRLQVGVAHMLLEQWDDALMDFEAMRDDITDVSTWLYTLAVLSELYLKKGEFENAIGYIDVVLKGREDLDGKSSEPYYDALAQKAKVLKAQGKMTEAETLEKLLPENSITPMTTMKDMVVPVPSKVVKANPIQPKPSTNNTTSSTPTTGGVTNWNTTNTTPKDHVKTAKLAEAVKLGNIEDVKHYLSIGHNPNGHIKSNTAHHPTPLHLAAKHNSLDIARLLLQAGALPNVAMITTADTPLHIAAAYGTPEMVNFLMDSGAALDVKNKLGMTPLQVMQRNKGMQSIVAYDPWA